MKRACTFLLIILSAVLFGFLSCDNPSLFGPPISSADFARIGNTVPDGVTASQGEKRSITLSWNEVPNSALYYIYSAESPLNAFVRCGETTSTRFKFNTPPGSTIYYRVSSVSNSGTESSPSFYVRGTSLAQPVISDITDVTESESAVTWYMENVFEDSYKNSLLYTVYCFNGSAVIAQIALDAAVISENRAIFTGLAPNTRYEYQVEAYLRGDQNESEKSDKMDASTARRFRPGAPLNLSASRGAAKDRITLSFELPDMVDIALGENLYDPKPLYFVIYKRFYSDSGNNEYQKACSYFGSLPGKGGTQFTGGYKPGATVTWDDTNGVSRDKKYEYLVQAYVDDTLKIITSDSSKTSSAGWALSEGTLLFGNIEYTMGDGFYKSASLSLDFEFDAKDESYTYNLIEKIEPLGDGYVNDPSGNINRNKSFDTYNAVRTYVPTMNLTQKTTQDNPGRGVYSYAVEIKRNGELLDTISTIGKKEISEDTEPIIVDNFKVQDGYTNKFVLKWDNHSNRKYTLYKVDADGNNKVLIGTVNDSPTDDSNATVDKNYSYTYEAGVNSGITLYFAIQPSRLIGGSPKQGQMVYSSTPSMTLGVPVLSVEGGYSYGSVTAAWTEAQKADTYRVKFRYTGESAYKPVATIKKENLSFDAAGNLKYTFKPEGTEIDIAKAGKEIQLQVDALNEGLRADVGGGEISTSSTQDVRARLLGPAELGLSAERASSSQEIYVSWNKITGADGYYVFRRKFNMNNTSEDGTETIKYYVPAQETGSINVTGKDLYLDSNNAKIDTTTVKAAVTFSNSRYRLTDLYMPDVEYDNAYAKHTISYRNQQNDMVQGNPYRYFVVPVLSGTALTSIDFVYGKDSTNKNTDISYYTIQEGAANIKYTGAAAVEKDAGMGFTIGFGQNVTATKGTYKSSGNVNDGIKITWSKPPLLTGGNIRYTVYRRLSGGTVWDTVASDINDLQYIDGTASIRGYACEYVIGITNGSVSTPWTQTSTYRRFIELCNTQRDERNRPFMLGFMLDMVEMQSVSRNEQKVGNDFAEEVKWYSNGIKNSAGLKNSFNNDYNWGIDGYKVFVMNRNIDAEWHEITDISSSSAGIKNQTTQSAMVHTGMGSATINTTQGAMTFDLLRVMRDYKHFFKIRSYVLSDSGEKLLCADPGWTYSYKFGTTEAAHIAASNDMQNDYVKWGARQITSDEFIKIASAFAGRGICESWADTSDKTYNAGTTWGGSGSVFQDYTYQAATDSNRTYTYTNFKVDLQTRTGQWVTFLTISGKIWARSYPIGSYPFRYGEDGWVTIRGPWDTPDLYTGQIVFGANKSGGVGSNSGSNNGGFSWNGNGTTSGGTSTSESGSVTAKIAVKYPSTAAEVQYAYRGQDTALQFKNQSANRYQLEEYK